MHLVGFYYKNKLSYFPKINFKGVKRLVKPEYLSTFAWVETGVQYASSQGSYREYFCLRTACCRAGDIVSTLEPMMPLILQCSYQQLAVLSVQYIPFV